MTSKIKNLLLKQIVLFGSLLIFFIPTSAKSEIIVQSNQCNYHRPIRKFHKVIKKSRRYLKPHFKKFAKRLFHKEEEILCKISFSTQDASRIEKGILGRSFVGPDSSHNFYSVY